ncbi:GGDEF domain-containing protein [Massilia sp. ML15P13]|uniref:diguanylate cyclase n=1 Tax=Telluria aromaticivorans TaxID=2725995 RepID=A0A7Y2JVH7_9BURK|nr:GGDEF domain-containing protein [Telluria aromaticivorans]NNG21681.1 GGDEF domain-containing protein [Telluria aromaticivorans]
MAIDPLLGEFADRRTEDTYLEHQQPRTRAQLAFTLLFCTLFFLCFFATDVAALGLVPDTALLLGARLVVAITAGSCAWLALKRPLSTGATRLAASLAEAVALACFMVIAVHRPGEFHWHAMSLAIMLLVIYLYIPNRLAWALGLASAATGTFLVLTMLFGALGFADMLTLGMLLALVNTFGALAARRYGHVAREEFRARVVLQHAAERDHLTGCFNRRYLHEQLMGAASPLQAGEPLTVILCDIDRFKQVNDTHGHAGGDAVITSFAGLLQSVARDGIDSVVRYGGEEFLLVLPGTGRDAGVHQAEWLRTRFAATPALVAAGDQPVHATASFGVATLGPGPHSAGVLEGLIHAADKLMYAAKRNGRDRVESLAQPASVPAGPLASAA